MKFKTKTVLYYNFIVKTALLKQKLENEMLNRRRYVVKYYVKKLKYIIKLMWNFERDI